MIAASGSIIAQGARQIAQRGRIPTRASPTRLPPAKNSSASTARNATATTRLGRGRAANLRAPGVQNATPGELAWFLRNGNTGSRHAALGRDPRAAPLADHHLPQIVALEGVRTPRASSAPRAQSCSPFRTGNSPRVTRRSPKGRAEDSCYNIPRRWPAKQVTLRKPFEPMLDPRESASSCPCASRVTPVGKP